MQLQSCWSPANAGWPWMASPNMPGGSMGPLAGKIQFISMWLLQQNRSSFLCEEQASCLLKSHQRSHMAKPTASVGGQYTRHGYQES